MTDQTIRELDEVIRLNPEDTTAYISRGYAYLQKGENDRAIEDYDNAVRLCPNYETDYIDSHFIHGGQEEVEAAIELLDSLVSDPRETAADFYYTGVRLLFINNRHRAQRCFEIALKLGYSDREKVDRHLENLKNQRGD